VFSIWHINGVDEKPLSIRMGEKDYSNMIAKIKKFTPKKKSGDSTNDLNKWNGQNTWLLLFRDISGRRSSCNSQSRQCATGCVYGIIACQGYLFL